MFVAFRTNTRTPAFFQYPRFLLDSGLNDTPRTLYMLLLDRSRLSAQRSQWITPEGKVFVYYTIQNLSKVLHRSESTVKYALGRLETAGMIRRQRQGIGRPNQIFVLVPATSTSEPESTPCRSQPFDPHMAGKQAAN